MSRGTAQRFDPDEGARDALLERFLAAAEEGDLGPSRSSSVSEAEDVAQETLLQLTRQNGSIDEPTAWTTTVATRLSINVLTSARASRDSYVGPWLPEPLLADPVPGPHAR